MKAKLGHLVLVLLLLILSCKQVSNPVQQKKELTKLEEIQKAGVLKVVTDYNSTSYFIYRGQPMGFQFELLQELADFMNVKLEVEASNDMQEKFNMLEKGDVDIIAVNLTVTKERKKFLDFTVPHTQTRQVLVQRRPENWSKISQRALEAQLVRNQLDMADMEIYVQQNSTYAKRLRNLSDEIGDSIHIVEVEDGVEKLIEKVASGEIDYTICDENVAQVNQIYFDNIDIATPVSFPQNLAWAVKKGESELKEIIDTWLSDFRKTHRYAVQYRKYFKNRRTAEILGSEYFAISSGTISPYDETIKKYSKEIDWDWRLVASMMYQESRFNPKAVSWAGAFGLMQLMPKTAGSFGVSYSSTPQQQIAAGIKFVEWLDERLYFIENEEERRNFILASYNVGLGHVLDARRLAEKHGKNPNIWKGNVDEYILKKSEKKYYTDPVVKYGYCRGSETYNYVAEIIERFDHYKNLVVE